MTVRVVVTAGGRTDLTGHRVRAVGEARRGGGRLLNDEAALEEVRRALTAAALANNASLQEQDRGWTVLGDPTEKGADRGGEQGRAAQPRRSPSRGRRDPVLVERKLTTANLDAETRTGVLALEGAPTSCSLAASGSGRLARSARWPRTAPAGDPGDGEALAGEALRTLGVAFGGPRPAAVSDGLEEVEQEIWLGIIGMIDPPRREAMESVALAKTARHPPDHDHGDHPGDGGDRRRSGSWCPTR